MASEDMIQHLPAAMVQDAPTPVGGNRTVENNEALRAKLTVSGVFLCADRDLQRRFIDPRR